MTGPPITTIERRGIEHVPGAERWGQPSALFWMWAGAVWNVEYVYYGAIAVVFLGLSFAQAVLIVLVGNLSYALTGLASVQGPRAGTTTFTISRAPFGPRGNKLPSFFNWITQVGFEIEGIAFIVFAAVVLTDRAGFRAWHAGQGRLHRRRGRDPGGAAHSRARCHAEGAPLARDPVRRAVRGDGRPRGGQGGPARRGPRGELGDAAGVPRARDLCRGPRLDGERQRLLALSARRALRPRRSWWPWPWARPSRRLCWRSWARPWGQRCQPPRTRRPGSWPASRAGSSSRSWSSPSCSSSRSTRWICTHRGSRSRASCPGSSGCTAWRSTQSCVVASRRTRSCPGASSRC